jgi:hypothetical protein
LEGKHEMSHAEAARNPKHTVIVRLGVAPWPLLRCQKIDKFYQKLAAALHRIGAQDKSRLL